tara:strand:- start:50 stop:256 length:207 start_codon:yes stop_codon:yes gene_type:complete
MGAVIVNAMEKQELDSSKLRIARWIAGCDEITEEIEFLLDKAYPEGYEQKFYDDWDNVLIKGETSGIY